MTDYACYVCGRPSARFVRNPGSAWNIPVCDRCPCPPDAQPAPRWKATLADLLGILAIATMILLLALFVVLPAMA